MISYSARKSLGQHFLTDQRVLGQITAALQLIPGCKYVEIGPGLGALTQHVLPLVPELTVIEFDQHIIPELEKNCAGLGKLQITPADVLTVDFKTLAQGQRLQVFGNLPYNISTPILFHLLEYAELIEDMCFMLQEEVVDRMVADPNSKTYGRLSVMLQYYCDMHKLFTVAPNAFHPPPKVYSAVVRLIPKRNLDPHFNRKLFADIVNHAFQQRRKTIHNSLKSMVNTEALVSANINPQARAENLSVDDYVRLVNYSHAHRLL